MAPPRKSATGLLGDTAERDYGAKLRRFAAFAAPELQQAIAHLQLAPGMRVLDAGCGTGELLPVFAAQVGPRGAVLGADLSAAHAAAARRAAHGAAWVVQVDLTAPALAAASFDLIWSLNTIHHLRAPLAGVRRLVSLLRPGGRLVLAQSSFLPDMYFAWDARLERLTNEAVRAYYRERYQASEAEFAGVRALLGLLRAAPLANVRSHSLLIERVAPLAPETQDYLVETIFRGTWGERLRPYLSAEDFTQLERLCDPTHAAFALRRPDFHFLQTLTLVSAQRPP